MLNRNTQLKSKTPLKSNGKGLKSNSTLKSKTTLKSNSVLKSNKPLLSGTVKLKNTSKIKSKSDKQKAVDSEYALVCKRIEKEREHVCTGCGTTETLTHSHLIPRSRRPDLVAVYENITLHCIENACHDKWEGVNRVELLDYGANMKVVKMLDEEYYNLIINKQLEYGRGKR
jgi:YesN/AraC family two-component response regulator